MFVSPACVVGAAKYLLIYDWNFNIWPTSNQNIQYLLVSSKKMLQILANSALKYFQLLIHRKASKQAETLRLKMLDHFAILFKSEIALN